MLDAGREQEAWRRVLEGRRRLPDSDMLKLNHSMLLRRARRHDEAAALLEPLAEKDWSHQAAAQVRLAVIRSAQGRTEEAESWFDRAIELAPAFGTAHYNRGVFLAEQRRFDEAQEAFERAVELDDRDYLSLANLGVLAARRGEHRVAIERLTAALSIEPEYPKAWRDRAQVWTQLGEAERARRDLLMWRQLTGRL